jgi:hypothetical protein
MMMYCEKIRGLKRQAKTIARLLIALILPAITANASNVSLSWNPSADSNIVSGYAIYVGTNSGSYSTRVDAGKKTALTVSNLTGGVTYFFVATAYVPDGTESLPSNEISKTPPVSTSAPPATPTGVRITSTGPAQIGLAWNASTDDVAVTSYLIERSTGQGGTSFAQVGVSTTLQYSDSALLGGTVYNYRVRAKDGDGNLSGYSSVVNATTSNSVPAAGGLVAAYGFEEGSGLTLGDSSGNGNSGALNYSLWTTNGHDGNALAFNGIDSFVDLGNPTSLQLTGSMTLEAWVFPTANPPDDGQIIAKSDAAPGRFGWQFKTSPDTGTRTFAVAISPDGKTNVQRYSRTAPALNSWFHIAGVFDATARTLDIYVNGVLDNGVLRGVVPASQFNPNLNATIGKRTNGYYFKGTIDELRVYNRALSQTEILDDLDTSVTESTQVPINTAPTISAIQDQTIAAGGSTGPLPFTVSDSESPEGNLTLAATTSNAGLVPTNNIVFGGSGSNRTVTVSALAGQTGSADITAQVSDGDMSASTTFTVNVTNAVTALPTIVLTSPAEGASYSYGTPILLAATVTANGNTIDKVQFYDGGLLLGEVASAPYGLSATNLAPGAHTLLARAVYRGSSTVDSAVVHIDVSKLPPPWLTIGIGSPGQAGAASISSGMFTVQGAGNISGTEDNFHFVYQPLTGDGEIVASINSVEDTGVNGRIGVMMREGLTPGSKYVFTGISPDGTFRWQRRTSTDGRTSVTTSGDATPPAAWVRLKRSGNTFSGYTSTDGKTWSLVSSRNIGMAANMYFGFAVASGSTNTVNTATFTNLSAVP